MSRTDVKRVQIVLNPTESKKLISLALLELDVVKKALKDGILAIHPSSSTYFMMEQILGQKPEGVWLVGMITHKGTCIEGISHQAFEEDGYDSLSDPKNFPFTWIFDKGRFETGTRLADLLNRMGPDDVYVKGVNAFDAHGQVAVLLASLAGGTIGRAVKAQKRNGFQILYPAGQEKFIAGSLKEVVRETGRPRTADALGIPCGILPINQPPFTEKEAYQVLAGVEVIPIASGGVGGAEGSIMLVLKGDPERVDLAMELTRKVKGARLPEITIPDCLGCHSPGCLFAGREIVWG